MANLLELTNNELRALDVLPDGIRLINKQGEVVYCNDENLKDYPVKRRQCTSDEFFVSELEDLNDLNIKNTEDFLDQIIQRQEKINEKSYTVRCAPIYEGEEAIGVVEIFRDVTRKKQLEDALRKESVNMDEDIEFAQIIQTQLLPRKGSYMRLNLDYIYRPSRRLSGDLFDVYEIDDDHIGMYVVDVAGHGVAASMMTVFIRQVMQGIFDKLLSPKQTLIEMQIKFQELGLDPSRYFTMFVGVYSVRDRVFTYSNAGHNCLPYVLNPDKNSYTQLISYGFPILSFYLNHNFEERSIELKLGDEILFFTDGLIEGRNSNNVEYSEDRLKRAILNCGPDEDLLDEIMRDFEEFSGGIQEDDIALLLLCIK